MRTRRKQPVRVRFNKHVNKNGKRMPHMPSRCWDWTGALNKDGYGFFRVAYKTHGSHRAAWIIANRRKVPEGLCVCHKCDRPSCVNPEHLFLGTRKDNIQDAIKKGRFRFNFPNSKSSSHGENHPRVKLTSGEVCAIREYCGQGLSKAGVARLYGVGESQIGRIVNFKCWRKAA